MTLRTRNLLIAALGLVLVAGVAYWFIANFHQVPFELRTPPSAAARRNRLLALEETLRTQGHTVFNRLRFSDDDFADPGNSAIVLDLDPRHLRASEVDHLLDFVARRGYSIFGWWRIVVGTTALIALWLTSPGGGA